MNRVYVDTDDKLKAKMRSRSLGSRAESSYRGERTRWVEMKDRWTVVPGPHGEQAGRGEG